MVFIQKIAGFLGIGRVREEAVLDLVRMHEMADVLRDEAMFTAQVTC